MPQQVLMAIGMAFVVLFIAAIIYLGIRLSTAEKNRKKAEEHSAVIAEDPLTLLRARYDAIFIKLNVPNNAMIVRLACNNYVSGGAALRHYCWLDDDNVMLLFPLWESLAGISNPAEAKDIVPRDWRIPVSDIVCFATEQGLQNKFVVLQYKKDGDVMTVAFAEDAVKVFTTLLPDKDFSQLLEEFYPKSSRNIRDIKENFASLRELREADLITEDEYAAKKKEMLILM